MVNEPPINAFTRELATIANRIIQDDIEPQEGARILALTCSKLWSLEGALLPFVALHDDWEEVPQQRAEVAREIVKAADRFRAQWGP
jgi:hypothetical protein